MQFITLRAGVCSAAFILLLVFSAQIQCNLSSEWIQDHKIDLSLWCGAKCIDEAYTSHYQSICKQSFETLKFHVAMDFPVLNATDFIDARSFCTDVGSEKPIFNQTQHTNDGNNVTEKPPPYPAISSAIHKTSIINIILLLLIVVVCMIDL